MLTPQTSSCRSHSPLRTQRLRSRKVELTHQIIVFQLRQEWFALPIQVAQKVIPLGTVYGAGTGATIGLTLYADREIPVLNLQQRIFGAASQPLLPEPSASDQPSSLQSESSDPVPTPQRFLVIVETITGEAIGLPLDSQPRLRRVPESAFVPLSDTYATSGHLRCVACLIVQASDVPPLFLLDLEQVLQAQPALPESGGAARPR